jgi:simple sugar transport system substrate-binding protein
MSDEDFMGDIVERLEWDERKQDETPFKRVKQVTRRTALTGGAAGIAAIALQACGGSSHKTSNTGTSTASASTGGGGSAAAAIFGTGQKYKFTMVNHVTTNTFFTPTQNGMADAAKLLGIPGPQWTGSQTSNVGEMVNSFNAALSAGVDGIGIALIDPHAFNRPVATAIGKGVPVVSYNADEPNARLAYIGQDLFLAGQEMGQHIVGLGVTGDVALFIATPGAANIQPRINGAMQVLKSHSNIHATSVTTGAAVPAELNAISSYVTGHPSTKGLFAVDGGSTQGIAQVVHKQGLRSKGVKCGGFDLTPVTETLLKAGDLDFTIDQQPYLQGFLPILELYLYKVSGGLTGPADVNTGLKFITKSTVGPYVSTKSRYEGTSSSPGLQKA